MDRQELQRHYSSYSLHDLIDRRKNLQDFRNIETQSSYTKGLEKILHNTRLELEVINELIAQKSHK